jgi:hypothetical protein
MIVKEGACQGNNSDSCKLNTYSQMSKRYLDFKSKDTSSTRMCALAMATDTGPGNETKGSLGSFTENRYFGRGVLMTKDTDEYFDFELHRYPDAPLGDNPNSDYSVMIRPDSITVNGVKAFEAGIAKWLLPLG